MSRARLEVLGQELPYPPAAEAPARHTTVHGSPAARVPWTSCFPGVPVAVRNPRPLAGSSGDAESPRTPDLRPGSHDPATESGVALRWVLLETGIPAPPAAEASDFTRGHRSDRIGGLRGVRVRCGPVAPQRSGLVGSPAAQVALELLGDGVTAGLRQVGGVLGLLEALDVLGHLGVGRRQLVDAALPRP